MSISKKSLKNALEEENPLQIAGTVNAYSAILAKDSGFKAIYLSGAGVANASYGLPDLGITSLDDVLVDIRRITGACDLPLLVDADTGWGGVFNIARCVREMIKAGASGLHLEDQVSAKRCGHRPGKMLVTEEEMCDRIKSAVDARTDENFTIMARTDALASEGLEKALERAKSYVDSGADMIFAEAVVNIEDYKKFYEVCDCPILANMTEFGKTKLYSLEELKSNDVSLILYPLSAFRAMNAVALKVYETIKNDGNQNNMVNLMQTREDLYKHLRYYGYEDKIDKLFKN